MTDNFSRDTTGATEATRMLDTDAIREANAAAAQADADDLAAQRAQRDRALGKVAPATGPDIAAPVYVKPTNDRFHASLGLFLLRLVTAGIMGVHGYQKLTNIAGTEKMMQSIGMPSPHWTAWGTGIAEVLAAVALLFGVFTRLAGLGVAAIGILALLYVKWRHGNPFAGQQSGFSGEIELLLAAVGVAFFFLGAGRWSIDGSVRTSRQKAKLEG